MVRSFGTLIVSCLLASAVAHAVPAFNWSECEFLPGRLIVDFAPGVTVIGEDMTKGGLPVTNIASLNSLFEQYKVYAATRLVPDGTLARLVAPPDLFRTYVLAFDCDFPVPQVHASFVGDPHVRWAEPDILRRVFRNPNDAYWQSQWDKRIVGAPAVWDVTTGSRRIICAGIDTGVDWNHPDLTPNLWVNPGEDLDRDSVAWTSASYPGDQDDINDYDDDANDYVDDFLGWDFIRNMPDCAAGEDCDSQTDNNMFGQNPHGTHVAGLMVARGNNGIGVAGMSWVGKLMALRAGFEDAQHNGYMPETATVPAILYAAANGAKIINMSYGGPSQSYSTRYAVNAAWNQGCLLFAASGNDGSTTPQYPANYENVIAVNATNSSDRLATWSNRGPWTDLCSPGAEPGIISTVINGYGTMMGTSMASPNAAGVAALIWSLFPNMTNEMLRDLLFSSAQDISAQNPSTPPSHLGHGRVDAELAMISLYPRIQVSIRSLTDTPGGDGDGRLERGETASLVFTFANLQGYAAVQNVSARIRLNSPYVTLENDSLFLGNIPSGRSVTNENSPLILNASLALDTALTVEILITLRAPIGYEETQTVGLRVGRGRILIVDDDGDATYEQFYSQAVQRFGVAQDIWTVATAGPLTASELAQYSAALWSCGDQQSSTLTAADRTLLSSYLDSGGKLLLVGQNIDEDLRNQPFYSQYLRAQTNGASTDRRLAGSTGHPVSDGMSLLLTGSGCASNGTLSPSRITPLNGAVPLFEYTQGGIGALTYDGAYKLAYFAFALEAACGSGGTTRFDSVVAAVFRWMNVAVAPPESRPAIPLAITLHGCYPNPFNAVTTIAFDLAAPARTRLIVHDLLGREVVRLLDDPLPAGSHRVSFDGRLYSTGVYFVRLAAGDVSRCTKIVLLK